MDNNQKEQYVLNEINKGIKMGMDSLSTISEKIGDENFKQNLVSQYDRYNEILNKVNSELKNYNTMPSETNPAQKAIGWMQIQTNTIVDKSNSHIAQMLIQGANMGVIEGTKLLNQNPNVNANVKNIVNEFIGFGQENIEQLKRYL